MKIENYLQIIGKTNAEFRKEYEEQAKISVKNKLVIEAIIKAENIEADEDKVEEKIKEMAGMYGQKEEQLKANENFINYIKESLKNEKAVEFIVENAKIK